MEAATSGGLQAGNNFAQDAAQVFCRAATDQIENLAKVLRGVAEHHKLQFSPNVRGREDQGNYRQDDDSLARRQSREAG